MEKNRMTEDRNEAAAKEFQKDTFIQEILGEDLSRKYIEAKNCDHLLLLGQHQQPTRAYPFLYASLKSIPVVKI